MDHILIAIGAILVASTLVLQRKMTPLTLFKFGTSTAAELEDNPPRRDPEYYFLTSTIIFRIDNTLFRVHENFLTSEENTLQSRIRQFSSPNIWLDGSSDARAIVLDDIPIQEFRSLLYYFYHERTRSLSREGEIEYLEDLLAVSDRTRMPKVRQHASERLRNLQPPLLPHKRVALCLRYKLPERAWLYPAVAELLEQVEPLDSEEAEQVGLAIFQKIAWMREDLRRCGDGPLPYNRSELIRYASVYLEGHPRHLSPLDPLPPAHRRVTK